MKVSLLESDAFFIVNEITPSAVSNVSFRSGLSLAIRAPKNTPKIDANKKDLVIFTSMNEQDE